MAYNNNFTMQNYFAKNYGLGNPPQKYHFKKKSFLVLLLFWPIWLLQYIIMTAASNASIKAWNDAYEYRRTNWYKEYDKCLEKAYKQLQIEQSSLRKLGIAEDDPDLQTVKPILLHGPKFNGYWRQAQNGTYRTSRHEYTRIIFKQEQVLFYIVNIDLLEPGKKKESTLEFFYSDITSVNTTTESTKPKNSDSEGNTVEEIDTEAFIIIVPGDKISLAFTPDDDSEASLRAMKNLIRERKKA